MQATTTLSISPHPVMAFVNRIEHWFGIAMLIVLAILPTTEAILRTFFASAIPYNLMLLQHLVLPLAFLGIALNSKEGRHLSISLGLKDRDDWLGQFSRSAIALVNGLIVGVYLWASISFIVLAFPPDDTVWFIPIHVFLVAYPLGTFAVLWRLFPKKQGGLPQILYLGGFLLSLFVGLPSISSSLSGLFSVDTGFLNGLAEFWYSLMPGLTVPILIGLVASAFLGTPLFIVLGGMSVFLFAGEGNSADVLYSQGYVLLTGNTVAAIALFTFAGYILSESKAGERFVRLFSGLFGRFKGGVVIVAVVVSAFFTAFTGGSGISILALGALLLGILKDSGGNSERLSVGLITGAGAIGLLFPPSLAIILYGSMAQYSILDLFIAGVLPGLLFVTAMILVGVFLSRKEKAVVKKEKLMTRKETFEALWASLPELLMPVIIIVVYFTGSASLVEAAAIAVVYILFVEVVIKREIDLKKFKQIGGQSLVIIGGILALLTFAQGLPYYFVDTGLPQALSEWALATIQSPLLFLLLVNIALFIVGCFMDIFSALTTIAPLLLPVAAAFGIHPAHMGIIFLSNLSVGFITPPVGMDLFLASYRFDRPMVKIYRDVVPFVIVQVLVVLIITYVPWFTTAFLKA